MDEDMKETADEIKEDPAWIKNEKELPEAKASITVRGYYKGFSVLITKRNADGDIELDKVMAAIDNMVAKGFKPSWAEETNGKHEASPMKKFDDDQAKQDACLHTNIKFAQSHTEKNPDKWFKACKDCGKFLGWQEK